MTQGEALAEAAMALTGVPFRLHGRDPATGLDCIGLLAAALAATGRGHRLPNGYRLRARSVPEMDGVAQLCGFVPATGPVAGGDVLFQRIAGCQFHLLIAVGQGGFVHAHAGIGRVTHFAGQPDGRTAGRWRLAETGSED